ncbi:MAG: isoprenylcysteine carboxylmethyltransferase family protein [Hyphomicrobiaceae bacterium]
MTKASAAAAERPNRLPVPPMIYLGAIAIAAAVQIAMPLSAGFPVPVRIAGAVCLGLGMVLDLAAILTLRRARTTFLPHRGSSALVTGGPYRLTRNPIYLGNTLALAGLGLALDWPVLLALVPVTVVLIDRLAIAREEAHLAHRFGEEFAAYRERVRRWI